jgi:hypothetical protein
MDDLPIPRQTLGSLLPDEVPPGGSDLSVVGERRRLCTHADHPAQRREYSAPATGHSPSDPRTRTICSIVESATASTHRSDWRPDRRQHTFWRLR